MDWNLYFQNFFSFHGPLLSMVQAAIGMVVAVLLTKWIAYRYEITDVKKVNIILLIIISLISGITLVLMGAIGLWLEWHPAIYYSIPLFISLILPKFIFKLNGKEFLIYIVLGISIGFLTHFIFSIFIGYNNYMPFWKINPIWEIFN